MKSRIIAMCLIAGLLVCESSLAQDAAKEPYPHLNSTADDSPARCALKPEEAAWLEARIKEKKLRLATQADIKAWEDLAKKKNRPIQKAYECGRVFVVLNKFTMSPKAKKHLRFSKTTLLLPANMEFSNIPNINGTLFTVLDLKNGGWYQHGNCDDGEGRGIGRSSRNCEHSKD